MVGDLRTPNRSGGGVRHDPGADRFDLHGMLPAKDEERAGVAVRAGTIIGSAIIAERGRAAFLWGMYIHLAEQRQGVGTWSRSSAVSRRHVNRREGARIQLICEAFYQRSAHRTATLAR